MDENAIPPRNTWRKLGLALFVFLFLGLLGLILGPTCWKKLKKLQSARLSIKAEKSLSKKDYNSAWEALQKSYSLDSQNANTSRLIAKIYETVSPQQALEFWKETLKITGSVEDRKTLIHNAIQANSLKIAKMHLDVLEKENIQDQETLFLEAKYYYAQGDLPQALQKAKQSYAKAPKYIKSLTLYTQLSLESKNLNEQQEALKTIKSVFAEKPNENIEILHLLSNYTSFLNKEDNVWLIQNLAKSQEAQDKLLSISLSYKQGCISQEDAITQAKQYFNTTIPESKAKFCQWLNSQGLYIQTLEQISVQASLSRQDLFLALLDAMAIYKQWDKLEDIFEKQEQEIPLEPYIIWMFKARIYKELQQEKRAKLAWERSILEVGTQETKLWTLLDYAIKMQDPVKVRIIFNKISKNSIYNYPCYTKWIQWEKEQKNLNNILELLYTMKKLFPSNTSIQNDLMYAELLLDKNKEQNLKLAKDLVLKEPSYLAHRITLCLAYLKNKQAKEALECILDLGVNWAGVQTHYKAIVAAALKANGYKQDAKVLLDGESLSLLLDQELQLLQATNQEGL